MEPERAAPARVRAPLRDAAAGTLGRSWPPASSPTCAKRSTRWRRPQAEGGMAPVYGLAASVPDRTLISAFSRAVHGPLVRPLSGSRVTLVRMDVVPVLRRRVAGGARGLVAFGPMMWVTVRDGICLTSLTIHGMTYCEEAEMDTHFPTLDPDVRAARRTELRAPVHAHGRVGSPHSTVVWGRNSRGARDHLHQQSRRAEGAQHGARPARGDSRSWTARTPTERASCAAAWTAR